jgi:hypothetical protein
VVEGESPYRATPGAQDESDDEDPDDDDEVGGPTGTVYRMFRTQLRRLDGGMSQYEELARTAAKLTTRK